MAVRLLASCSGLLLLKQLPGFQADVAQFAYADITLQNIALKKTQWPLVRKRTIPIEQPPLVDEI
jgi:hypothetical protein